MILHYFGLAVRVGRFGRRDLVSELKENLSVAKQRSSKDEKERKIVLNFVGCLVAALEELNSTHLRTKAGYLVGGGEWCRLLRNFNCLRQSGLAAANEAGSELSARVHSHT